MEKLADNERSLLLERFGRSYDAGSIIYEEGEVANECFLVREGTVRLFRSIRGETLNVAVLDDGELFGVCALSTFSPKRRDSAVALSKLTVLALDRATFSALLAGHADVADQLVERLVRRLHAVEEQLERALLPDTTARVVGALLGAAEQQNQDTSQGSMVLTLTPLQLASSAVVDTSNTQHCIEQLTTGGYLEIIGDNSIVIRNVDGLRRLHHLLGLRGEIRAGFP